MSFDLSRVRFHPRHDFLGVVMQQGRVQLDSDWNEWLAQLVRRIEAGTLDTLGAAVVPRETPDGFAIQAAGGDLTIGPGRIYVDGLLAENHGGAPPAWNPRLAEEVGSAPVPYAAQPYRPHLAVETDLPEAGPHLVYLDVWRREVTHLQDPELVEQAVGIDTTGRRQTVWQVKLLPDVGNVTCATDPEDIPGWTEVTRSSEGRLSTSTGQAPGETPPCQVAADAGYLGLENQLYRVEIHEGGPLGEATFKWSRDNGAVASRVTHISPRNRLTVESLGRDEFLSFHEGDWVEVSDDWLELQNAPGVLARIATLEGVDESERTLTLEADLPASVFPVDAQGATDPGRHTRVRRWDQAGKVYREDGTVHLDLEAAGADGAIPVPDDGSLLFLEKGVLVRFDVLAGPGGKTGRFKSGDHWAFAARAADASVEELALAPPLGIHHHHARLAVVTLPDAETDCRILWPPKLGDEGCECTVCVHADAHNEGTATLQQALDRVKDTGGTVCLGAGLFRVAEGLRLVGADSVRLRGQGWKTVLVGQSPGPVLSISDGTGIALENLTVMGSAAGDKVTSALHVSNVVDLRLHHVNVVSVATSDATSAALELSGYLIGCEVTACVLVAERGLASATGKRDALLTAELRVRENVLFCRHRGISFDEVTLHAGTCALSDNLILGCSDSAVVALGGVLAGGTMTIADNVLHPQGTGVRAGTDRLRIERNDLRADGDRSGDGISIERGLDPLGIEGLMILGNRISRMGGHAIAIRHRVANAMIKQNMVGGAGLAGLAIEEGGSVVTLAVENNQFSSLGTRFADGERDFAGLQIFGVDRLDLLHNLVEQVASGKDVARAYSGVLCLGSGEIRLEGNRVHEVGPPNFRGSAAGLRFPALRGHLALEANAVTRTHPAAEMSSWYALLLGRDDDERKAGTTVFDRRVVYLDTGELSFLLTAARVRVLTERSFTLSARGNRFQARQVNVPLALVQEGDTSGFLQNHGQVSDARLGQHAQFLEVRSDVVDVSHNRFLGVGGLDGLSIRIATPQRDRTVLVGNVTSGRIEVNGQAPASPWDNLNVYVE